MIDALANIFKTVDMAKKEKTVNLMKAKRRFLNR
jgi:hypothetical protein